MQRNSRGNRAILRVKTPRNRRRSPGRPGRSGFVDLHELAVKRGVVAALRQQLRVGAALDHPPRLEHEHEISVADRAQAVGDDEAGAAPQQGDQRPLDARLRQRVDRNLSPRRA